MTVDKKSYIAQLETLAKDRQRPNCEEWPLSHTIASDKFRLAVEHSPPTLLSRSKQGMSPSGANDGYVFAYAAPRPKPLRPPKPAVVILFRARTLASDKASVEIAHPFDSGGLRKHHTLRDQKRDLVTALTFEKPWRPYLALFVAALFDDLHSYLEGTPPNRADPLDIGSSLREHDALFYTWEIKTEDSINFTDRLVAVLVTEDEDGRLSIADDMHRELLLRDRAGEIKLRTVERSTSEVHSALLALYELARYASGWR